MFAEIKTVKNETLYLNLNNVTTIRVVPVATNKYAIALVVMPGKELLVRLNGINYYEDRNAALQVVEQFSDDLTLVMQGKIDELLYVLQWFDNGDDNGGEE